MFQNWNNHDSHDNEQESHHDISPTSALSGQDASEGLLRDEDDDGDDEDGGLFSSVLPSSWISSDATGASSICKLHLSDSSHHHSHGHSTTTSSESSHATSTEPLDEYPSITLVNTHLNPSMSSFSTQLSSLLATTIALDGPVILMGTFGIDPRAIELQTLTDAGFRHVLNPENDEGFEYPETHVGSHVSEDHMYIRGLELRHATLLPELTGQAGFDIDIAIYIYNNHLDYRYV